MEASTTGRVIDLDGLRRNVRLLRGAVPSSAKLLAVVKADAYGHGAVQVAKAALEAGASWLAVALPKEGAVLRQAGVQAPILVLGACGDEPSVATGVEASLTLTLTDADELETIERVAARLGKMVNVHLKLDTGMNRIGVRTEAEVTALLDQLKRCEHVRLTGAFTHFADADGNDLTFTRIQLARFKALCALLPEGIVRHCANSAAIHRLMPEAAFDMVRMGISMYGYPPVQTELPLMPFMRWTAEVTFVKSIAPGDAVSYGRTWQAERPTRLATICCGYGDGYHRAASGQAEVLIRGKRAKVVGRICMDQMMVDVTDIPEVRAGDIVTLMGRDGEEEITAEDLARWAGTISYEVLLAATGRVERHWLHA